MLRLGLRLTLLWLPGRPNLLTVFGGSQNGSLLLPMIAASIWEPVVVAAWRCACLVTYSCLLHSVIWQCLNTSIDIAQQLVQLELFTSRGRHTGFVGELARRTGLALTARQVFIGRPRGTN